MKSFIATLVAASALASAAIAGPLPYPPSFDGPQFGPSDIRSFDGPASGPNGSRTFDGPAFGPSDVRSFDGPARTWQEGGNQR
jgi:hypothetical protein